MWLQALFLDPVLVNRIDKVKKIEYFLAHGPV